MPFGPYKDFDDCVASVSRRKNPPSDPKAYCGWIKDKIEGGELDEEVLVKAYHQHLIDNPLEGMDHLLQLATWDSKYRTSLPDSSFAWIDKEGGRHLPYKTKEGKVDIPHTRAALARLNQVKGLTGEKEKAVRAKLEKALTEANPKNSATLYLMTKEDAKRILNAPGDLKEWGDAQLIDDHRWVHLWEKTLERKDKLFISKDELKKLHEHLLAEMKKRGMDSAGPNHKSPINIGAPLLELSSPVRMQDPILLDPEFISIVGSAVTDKDPQSLEILMKCPPNEKFQEALLNALPEGVKDRVDFIFEATGPNGPYIPAYALYAVPLDHLSVKEPKLNVTPLSPTLPATPTALEESELVEDSYYVEAVSGTRMMVHRNGDVVIGFGTNLEEVEIAPDIISEVKSFEGVDSFILDGFMEDGVYRMIDLLWLNESQHVKQTAEVRRGFLAKLPETDHVKRSEAAYFENKAETLKYLRGKNGPLMLIPGTAPYPIEGESPWKLFKKSAYLVKARLGAASPIVCSSSSWIAIPGEEWSYLKNSETVWPQLVELGIGKLVGNKCQEGAIEAAAEHDIHYELTQAPTITQFLHGLVTPRVDLASAEIVPEELRGFYDSIRPLPREVMKLSCGGIVPLNRLRLQKGLYNRHPQESKYSIQFHVAGLSVHADLRYQVNTEQAIGWTMNLGGSLIKPMLRRTPEALREQAGITAKDLKLPIKALSDKLYATDFGQKLGNAFTKKIRSLERALIKTMLREVWTDEVQPILASSSGVLSQRKYPTAPAWLRYEAVPAGAVGATNELAGTMFLMDMGTIKFGAQNSNVHEYWLDGKYVKGARLLFRKFAAKPEWGVKEKFGWMAYFSKKLDGGLRFSVMKKNSESHLLLIHDDEAVHQTWDFGKSPLGELPVRLIAPQTHELYRTMDAGRAAVIQDTNHLMQLQLHGSKLKGDYVLAKDGETWSFGPASISEKKRTMLLQAASCTTQCSTTGVLHLAASDDMTFEQVGDLLFIRGPAIKPGEVLPMDGRPSYFTKEGIKKFWPSMYRQPIVVLHGDLKGDVIGFVSRNWFDEATGWGWIEGIVWHPQGIKLIMNKTLPAFSIEVIPESVWDAEHKHEHVIGGECVGLAVVPKGACVTCTPTEATMGTITVEKGKVFKYGMTAEQYIADQYWARGKSTMEIARLLNKPRSTIESWMNQADIPRRSHLEARRLRQYKENAERKFGGRAFITNLGKGATLFTIGDEHLLINAPEGIATMLGFKKLKPKYVLIENPDNAVGIEELGSLAPAVLATEKTWKQIRVVKYKGKRMVIPHGKIVKIGAYMVKAVELGDSTAYKIDAAGTVIVHASTAAATPDEDLLKDVDIYIGDGSSLKEDTDGHISMVKQTLLAKDAEVLKILFTNPNEDYEELSIALQDIAPNASVLEDGAELQLSPGNPGAHFSLEEAEAIAAGDRVIVRAKPYQEYAKQAIFLLGGDKILGLFVEGFPEGPMPVEKAKKMEHGLSDKTWAEKFADVEQVWIYRPRMLKTFEHTREFRVPEALAGPYITHVKAVTGSG